VNMVKKIFRLYVQENVTRCDMFVPSGTPFCLYTEEERASDTYIILTCNVLHISKKARRKMCADLLE